MRSFIVILNLLIYTAHISASNPTFDTLYGQGVDAYSQKDYKNALRSFLSCDSVLSLIHQDVKRDSTYVNQWIASCYYKLHHYKKAIDYNSYSFGYEPIDKRLTIESDSLADLASNAMNNSNYELAIELLNRAGQLEKNNLGDNWYYINTLFNLYDCHNKLGHHSECESLFNLIIQYHNKRYGEISPLEYWTYAKEGFRRIQCKSITNKEDVLYILNPFLESVKQYNLINHVGFAGNFHLFASFLNNEDLIQINACIAYLLMNLSDYESEESSKKILKALALSFFQKADPLFIDSLKSSISGIQYNFEQVLAASLLKLDLTSEELFDHTWRVYNIPFDTDGFEQGEICRFLDDYRSIVYDYILTNPEGCQYRNGLLVNLVKHYDGNENAMEYILQLVNSNKLAYADYLTRGLCDGGKIEDTRIWSAINSEINNISNGQRDFFIRCPRKVHEKFDYAKNLDFIRLQRIVVDSEYEFISPEEEPLLQQYCQESDIYFPLGFLNYRKSLRFLCRNDIEQAINFAEEAYNNFRHDFEDDNLLIYNAYKLLGITHLWTKENETTSQYFRKAIEILNNYKNFHSELVNPQPLYFAYSFLYFKDTSSSYEHILNEKARKEFEDWNNPLSDDFVLPSVIKDEEFRKLYNSELLSLTDFLIPFQKNMKEWEKSYNNSWIAYNTFTGDSDWIENSVRAYSLDENIRPEWIDDLCWYSHFLSEENDLSNLLKDGCDFFRKFLKTSFIRCNSETRTKIYTEYYEKRDFSKIIEDNLYHYSGNPLFCSKFFQQTLPYIAVKHPASYNLEILYNGLLIDKGILLSTEQELKKIILNCGNDTIISLFDKYNSALSKLETARSTEEIESLKHSVLSIENELIERSKNFGDFTKFLDYTWSDIYNSLKENEVAIEFFETEENENIILHALLLNKDCKFPILVTLPDFPNTDGSINLELLYNSIWKPLLGSLSDNITTIYFSPCSSLYTLPIEASLYGNSDQNFYHCHRLSSTRELVINHTHNINENFTLYGGLKYDISSSVLIADSKKYPHRSLEVWSDDDALDSLNLRNGAEYLPGTKNEVLNIWSQFNTNQKENCKLFTDSLGTEASFKNISGKNMNIIHIATHGFYFSSKEARRIESSVFPIFGTIYNSSIENNALSRSGLLFSGANLALQGNRIEGIEDGILTAKEISLMDLSNVEFLVLSACQTGLGEIHGDGVYGLQRGFKKAGVQSLLMSLWKVDDRATQMLMTNFYEHFLSGKSKLESLNLAQKYVREYEEEVEMSDESNMTASQKRRNQKQGEEAETEKIKVKPFADPKYWASFILLDALD